MEGVGGEVRSGGKCQGTRVCFRAVITTGMDHRRDPGSPSVFLSPIPTQPGYRSRSWQGTPKETQRETPRDGAFCREVLLESTPGECSPPGEEHSCRVSFKTKLLVFFNHHGALHLQSLLVENPTPFPNSMRQQREILQVLHGSKGVGFAVSPKDGHPTGAKATAQFCQKQPLLLKVWVQGFSGG